MPTEEQPRNESPAEDDGSVVKDFVGDETGAVILEYVTLLIGVLFVVYYTIQPLQNALLEFAEDVFFHLTLP